MTNTMTVELQQKKKRQIIILAVVGGLLVLLMAFQLPKLLGGDDAETAAAEETATETASDTAVDGTATTSTTTSSTTTTVGALTIPAGRPIGTAYLAGVIVPGAFANEGGEGRLLVFNQLPTKDPFVQQVDDKPVTSGGGDGSDGSEAANASSSVTPASSPATATGEPGKGTTVPSGSSGSTTPVIPGDPVKPAKPPVLTFATINVNGTPVAVEVKKPFPSPQNLFVVTKLTETDAKLAIAGDGGFTGGRDAVTLKMGKALTLVDQATGVRYTLKLLYTGTSPEQTAEFTAPADDQGAAGK